MKTRAFFFTVLLAVPQITLGQVCGSENLSKNAQAIYTELRAQGHKGQWVELGSDQTFYADRSAVQPGMNRTRKYTPSKNSKPRKVVRKQVERKEVIFYADMPKMTGASKPVDASSRTQTAGANE